MLLGAHESVAGGLARAIERGQRDGCRAIQVFTKNSGMWREPVLTGDVVTAFRAAHEKARADRSALPILAHTSYLINLATADAAILQRSVEALVCEVNRCSALGIAYVVLHPGAHLGAGDDVGVKRAAEALAEVLERTRGASAAILLENTAGQGSCVGHRFEHLAAMLEPVADKSRVGVCFDTQHAFAAGYDLSTAAGYDKTFSDFDRIVGLSMLRAFHLNDSKKALGSRVDRHEHVGEGNLGVGLFWRLANDARFAEVPGVVETEPREMENGESGYKDEVALLQGLAGAPEPAAKAPVFVLEPPASAAPAKKKRR